MKKSGKNYRLWWILVLLIIMAVIAAVIYMRQANHETARPLLTQEKQQSTQEGTEPRKITPDTQEPPLPDKQVALSSTSPNEQAKTQVPEQEKQDYCKVLERDIAEFFKYLDTKKYIQHLELGENMLTHFKSIVQRLSSRPPVPAGEGVDSRLLASNIYHFYRTLGRKDIRLIREILHNEEDTLEINMNTFYKWFAARDKCKDQWGLRPSFKVAYRYAGFFLNTIGGRAYLLRRDLRLRLLATYYSVLIIYEADLRGLNTYGIDILPYVASLEQELHYFKGLEFQSEYLDKLYEIEQYYMGKR